MAPLAPDGRHDGVRIQNHLRKRSANPARQIEDKVLEVPQVVFDVVAENP